MTALSLVRCCICEAKGQRRPGLVRKGHVVPLCSECFSTVYWKSRQPAPVKVITFPLSPEEAYFRHAQRLGQSLSDIVA